MKNIKKWLAGCLSVLFIGSLLSGCNINEDASPHSPLAPVNSTQEQDSFDMQERAPDIEGKNVLTVESVTDMAIDTNIETLSNYASEIITGTVVRIAYTTIQGNAWTMVDVKTDNVLKGAVNSEQVITIYFLGGYIPLTDKIEYYQDSFRYENMTKQEIENTVVHEVVDGEVLPPTVGKQYLFYLAPTPKGSPLPQNVFERIGGRDGQLDSEKLNTFSRRLVGTDQVETYTISQIEGYLN